MNRVIDGVDLDGLEYLKADQARVEFKYGKLQLKIENFHSVTQKRWNDAANDPKNWSEGCIGIDPTIANIQLVTVGKDPELTDDPDLPNKINPKGLQSIGVNRAGRREIEKQKKQVNTTAGQGKGNKIELARSMAKAMTVIQALEEAANYVANALILDDQNKIKEHQMLANKSIQDVQVALQDVKYNNPQDPNNILIPDKYRNESDLASIMNVVLTGQNNTDNKEIYDIGMKIFHTISKPPISPPIMTNSQMDNYPSKPIILDAPKKE